MNIKNNGLEQKRRLLDEIDKKLIELIKKRHEISLEIGKIKKNNKLKIINKKREMKVVQKRLSDAKKLGLDEKFIKKLFKLIFKASRDAQKHIYRQ